MTKEIWKLQRLMNVTLDEEEGDTCRERFTVIHTAMSKRGRWISWANYLAITQWITVDERDESCVHASRMRIDSHAVGFVCEIRYITSDCAMSLLTYLASRIKSRHSPWNGTWYSYVAVFFSQFYTRIALRGKVSHALVSRGRVASFCIIDSLPGWRLQG